MQLSAIYSQYLQGFEWDYLATITFRHPRHDSISSAHDISKFLIGNNWSGNNIDRAFLISEPHTTGFLHFHGLLHEQRNYYRSEIFRNANYYRKQLYKRYGFSDVSAIKGMAEVAGYCSKYVAKAIDDAKVDYYFAGDWGPARHIRTIGQSCLTNMV